MHSYNRIQHVFAVMLKSKIFELIFGLTLPIPTDFIPLHSVTTESLSVDTFSHKNDVYVAIAAPNIESCMVLQWDHIEMNFRTYDNITGTRKNSKVLGKCIEVNI